MLFRRLITFFSFLFWSLKLLSRVRFRGFAIIVCNPGSKISWGHSIVVNSSFYSNLIGMQQRAIVVARDGGTISIGDRVGISGSTIYATKRIEIGADTVIGANCKIIDNDFHPTDPDARRNRPTPRHLIPSRPIVIGCNCFIGADAIILKGTTLGDNTVVGAGSVVCGDFSSGNQIIAGNPARVISDLAENETEKSHR